MKELDFRFHINLLTICRYSGTDEFSSLLNTGPIPKKIRGGVWRDKLPTEKLKFADSFRISLLKFKFQDERILILKILQSNLPTQW